MEHSEDPTLVGEPDAAASARERPRRRRLEAGDHLGRYLVLSVLGSGAMGIVYAAFDPELDRRVAIKVIQPSRVGEDGQARLLREAQALARLTHPNVVAVHDVGTHDGQVFVAMEFVAGHDLAEVDWGQRGWAETVEIYRKAGLGLAAAHEAGLIHRDFKPANVMLSETGRVVVMDFGLARAAGDDDRGEDAPVGETPRPALPEVDALHESLSASRSSFDARITQTGSMLGTPAYMAPELFTGGRADALSDQFAFCVALFEGLYGQRPFKGETFAALAFNITQGEIVDVARSSAPSSVHEALVRGLAAKPSERWPSMDALLEALAVDPTRRRRVAVGVVGGLAVLAAVAIGAYSLGDTRAPPAVCTGSEAAIAEVWSDGRRASVRQHLAGLGPAYAESTAERVLAGLDRYAAAWATAHREACEATRTRGEQSEQILDLRMACLDRNRDEFDALVDLLAVADVELLARAVRATRELTPVAHCADLDALTSSDIPEPEGELLERVTAVRREVARGRAAKIAGQYAEADAIFEALGDLSEFAEAYPPVIADVRHEHGNVMIRLTEFDAAEAALRDAWTLSLAHRDFVRAGLASTSLSFVIGYVGGDYERAFDYADQALGLADATDNAALRTVALGQKAILFHGQGKVDRAIPLYEASIAALPDTELRAFDLAGRRYNLALARREHGQVEEALTELHEVAALYREVLGTDKHADVIDVEDAIANTLLQLERYDEAEVAMTAVYDDRVLLLGAGHPSGIWTINSLGNIAMVKGDYAEAHRRYDEAEAIVLEHYSDTHPNMGMLQYNKSLLAIEEGKPEDGIALARRSLEIREQVLGKDNRYYAYSLDALATAEHEAGYHADALIHADETLEAIVRAQIEGEALEGLALLTKAQALRALGRDAEAEATLSRARTILEATVGSGGIDVAKVDVELGLLESKRGDHDPAIARVERVVDLRQELGLAPATIAGAEFALAQILEAAGREPDRARALAESAARRFSEHPDDAAEVDAWLAAHRPAGN